LDGDDAALLQDRLDGGKLVLPLEQPHGRNSRRQRAFNTTMVTSLRHRGDIENQELLAAAVRGETSTAGGPGYAGLETRVKHIDDCRGRIVRLLAGAVESLVAGEGEAR